MIYILHIYSIIHSHSLVIVMMMMMMMIVVVVVVTFCNGLTKGSNI